MPTLRLTQSSIGQDQYRVEVSLEGEGMPRQTAVSQMAFQLTPQDQEDLRWYLEDYLQYPLDPAPKIAARVEGRIAEIGSALFQGVFKSSDDASDLWATLRTQLNETRVEIISGVREATVLPWELLRDPKTDTPLSLSANAFVRAQPQAAQRPHLPSAEGEPGPIRILLAICRPGQGDDVPFRSVASRIIKGLGESAREAFQLDVLRPPTFDQLGRVLRQAKSAGRPYHVLHFDGHGLYADVTAERGLARLLSSLSPLVLAGSQKGPHGYLLFENSALDGNAQLVGGQMLGKLLVETDVPVLVLNACRSAHAEASTHPEEAGADVHTQVRAYGSLAQVVMDQGVAGVVAMRYNVYVVTAAQFVTDLYAALTQGETLGEAVTLGRKQLSDQPLREIGYGPRPLQDWPVPIVYEAAAIKLFSEPVAERNLTVTLDSGTSTPGRRDLDPKLPSPPDIGFFGRDETLLALDRAFDTQRVVLLHAYAGSGKTSTAAEFARWYTQTSGVDGPVLFTSFEQYRPLARVLDQFGTLFGPVLEEARGIHWLTLTDTQRRNVTLQVLSQIPVLWIWDNVEPVTGFPSGTTSAWSEAEQQELATFLRDAAATKAKFLLTSRRDEDEWLGNLPVRIPVPPMPMQERVQLARALAEKHNRRLIDVADWRPLLRFTDGNPLTITVLVGQALRDGLETREEIEEFVAKLQAGEAVFEDAGGKERSKSLRASLSYGFQEGFTEDERKILALLHFFQGFVNSESLSLMANPAVGRLSGIDGLTPERGIILLDRAADIGLLTARGDGRYSIHPALPWHFKALFEMHFPSEHVLENGQTATEAATQAFVKALTEIANRYQGRYQVGHRSVVTELGAEEGNFLHALRLARQHLWWREMSGLTPALLTLYDHEGRNVEGVSLIREVLAGLPSGVEPLQDYISYLQVQLARQTLKWSDAENLQQARVDKFKQSVAGVTQSSSDQLEPQQRQAFSDLASAYALLGDIQIEQGHADGVGAYQEAINLYQFLGDRTVEASYAFKLGNSHLRLPFLSDLQQAEHWYKRSLTLFEQHDPLMSGRCYMELGVVAYARLKEAIVAYGYARREPDSDPRKESSFLTAPKQQLVDAMKQIDESASSALKFYVKARSQFIELNAVSDLAAIHARLGDLQGTMGLLDVALDNWREAVRGFESMGNTLAAGDVRLSIAGALARNDRLVDAKEYVNAALRDYQSVGSPASHAIEMAKGLLYDIETKLNVSPTEYDKLPSRDPYFPIKGGGRHVKLYKLGKYVCSFFTDFQSPGPIQYVHIMYVFEEGKSTPIFAVAAEGMRGADYCILGSFDGSGHANYGSDENWRDLGTFMKKALSMAVDKFKVSESPQEISVPGRSN